MKRSLRWCDTNPTYGRAGCFRRAWSKLQLLEVVVVLLRAHELILGTFLFHIARLLLYVGNRGEQGAQVQAARAQFRVVRSIRNDILDVKTPIPAAISLEILQRFSSADFHVPEIELQPDPRGIGALEEQVVRRSE